MSHVILRYRKWVPRGVRRKLSPAELEAEMKLTFNGLSHDTDPEKPEVFEEGGVGKGIADPLADSDLPTVVIKFGFWSVRGALSVEAEDAKGDKAVVIQGVTRANKISFKVAPDQDVIATAWYYADDSTAQGLQIDAFDADLGDWVLDNFVDVEPDTADGELTFRANEDGLVSTATEENVVAYEQIHAVPFGWWRIVAALGGISVNKTYKNGGPAGRALTAAAASSGVAWAYYFTPEEDTEKEKPPEWEQPEFEVPVFEAEVSLDVPYAINGRERIPFHPCPWDPPGPLVVTDFITGLTLASVPGKGRPELRAGTLELAARQLSLAADTISSDRAFRRRFRALSAVSSVVSASLGAATLRLVQGAAPEAGVWIAILGASGAAAIGYFLPAALSKSFTRS